jgi:hypothetical protein
MGSPGARCSISSQSDHLAEAVVTPLLGSQLMLVAVS